MYREKILFLIQYAAPARGKMSGEKRFVSGNGQNLSTPRTMHEFGMNVFFTNQCFGTVTVLDGS